MTTTVGDGGESDGAVYGDENDNIVYDKPSPRSLEECLGIYKSDLGAAALSDEEVISLVEQKHIPSYQIEKAVDDPERGVKIRRRVVGGAGSFEGSLYNLPYKNYDYSKVCIF